MHKSKIFAKKDILLLEALQNNARMHWSDLGKKTRMLRETAYYRVSQLEKQGVIKQYTTFIDVSKDGLEIYSVFMNLNVGEQHTRESIIETIVLNPYVTWVATLGSCYDVVFAVQARGAKQFKDIYAKLTTAFREHIQEEHFSQRVSLVSYSQGTQGKRNIRSEETNVHIDDVDRKLLQLLATNSRMSLIELGTKIGKPFTTIQTRLKKLEAQKIISGYGIAVDYAKLGKLVFQVLLTTAALADRERMQLEEFCRKQKEILFFVDAIAAWNYELTIAVENHEELQQILNELKELLGVKLKVMNVIITFDYYRKYCSVGKTFMEVVEKRTNK